MGWFKRQGEGIKTSTKDKKETPEGLWYKCPKCQTVVTSEDHIKNVYVCERCSYHDRIGSEEYFQIFFDEGKYKELDKKITSDDPLKFEDTKKYVDRVKDTQKKTGLTDAIRTAHGKIDGQETVIAAMDFSFIGGSMGSVVGEKIARAIDMAKKKKSQKNFELIALVAIVAAVGLVSLVIMQGGTSVPRTPTQVKYATNDGNIAGNAVQSFAEDDWSCSTAFSCSRTADCPGTEYTCVDGTCCV